MKTNKIFLLALGFSFTACSSAPDADLGNPVANLIGEERVVARMDGMTSRPEWLKESEPFVIANGKVQSLGMAVIPGDHNLAAGFRIAENNAKASVSGGIEQRLSFIFQNAEETTEMGINQVRYIGAEASSLTTNALRLSKRYYEKVAIQENNQVILQYRIFVLSEMPESSFKTAIVDAIRRSQGKKGISEDFAKKVESHWESISKMSESQPRSPTANESNE